MKRRGRRRAFTLMEILIGMAVLMVFMGIVYTIWSRMSGSGAVGIWREQTHRDFSRSMLRLRKAIEEASYPHGVTPAGSSTAENEGYFVTVGADGTDGCKLEHPHATGYRCRSFTATGADDQVLLVIYKSNAARKGISGIPDQKGKVQRIEFRLRGGEVVRGASSRLPAGSRVKNLVVGTSEEEYEIPDSYMSAGPDTPCITVDSAAYAPAAPDAFTPIQNHVSQVQICVPMSGAKTAPDEHPFIELAITCVEPHEGRTIITNELKAKPHTGVKFD